MTIYGGPDIVTDGLVLNLDAANMKSFDPVNVNTELLLHMDGANNSTSFVDSSKNGFTVTAVGNAKISTDQSKFGVTSAAFDGTGDYLEVPASVSFAYPSDFTCEFWFRMNTIKPAEQNLVYTGVSGGLHIYYNGPSGYFGGPNSFRLSNNITNFLTLPFSVSTNVWYHLAVTRSGSTLRMFVNGVQIGSASTSYSFAQGILYLGPGLDGYIDELRIVKGKALYTSNFTPERKPYLDGNKIYDLSGETNNGTLVNGPAYSSSNGGVLSFDGTNDSVNIALNSSLQSQYFTYDIWFNLNSVPVGGTSLFMSHYQNNGTISGLTVFEYLGQYRFQTRFNNQCCQNLIVGNSSANTWINFCGTWNGSVKVAYLNGVQAGTQAASGTHSQLNIFTIGNNADNIAVGNYSGAGAANAKIPTVKYYNRPLSANEISQNYNALKGRFGL